MCLSKLMNGSTCVSLVTYYILDSGKSELDESQSVHMLSLSQYHFIVKKITD